MILPTKHVSTSHSLLGLGAFLLQSMRARQTVSQLWERVRLEERVGSYQRFVLALDLLYLLGAVELREGILHRRHR
jgi:hypothetical protein